MGLCFCEFVKKVRIKYPEITDGEIANFIRIYLKYKSIENYEESELYFDNWIWIARIFLQIPQLKQSDDYNYIWMIENNKSEFIFHSLFKDIIDMMIFLFKACNLLFDFCTYNYQ